MPVYQCATTSGILNDDQRDRLAKGITAIHSEETQAPEPFIRVVFADVPEGYGYTAGKPAPSVILDGSIRAGRPESTRRTMLTRLFDLLREVTGVPPGQIVIAVKDFPSHWASEAGFVLPEPTAEAEEAWMRSLHETGATL